MLDNTSWKTIISVMQENDAAQERVIRVSRNVVKMSKLLIYALHRNDREKAESLEKGLISKVEELRRMANEHKVLFYCGSYKVAMQEYVEAVLYLDYTRKKELRNHEELGVSVEHYLLGLCDLTGELVRRAVNVVIEGDFIVASEIRDFVTNLYGHFLNIDFKNGELRKKFDSIKYGVKKLEDIIYELKIREKI